MTTIKFNGNILDMDNRIDEMLYHKYLLYNMNVMIDSGIGSDFNSFNDRFQEIVRYASVGDMENLRKVIANTQQCYQFIMSRTSPEMQSFICMIRTINGESIGELTDEKIKQTILQLSKKGLTVGKVKGFLNSLKKKIPTQFETLLPNWVDSTSANFYSMLKQRTDLVLDGILGKDVAESIAEVERRIFEASAKPKLFAGANAVHIQAFRNYNDTCTLIRQNHLGEPKKMTVVEYYQAIDFLKKLKKPKK
jgi:hypothetical protein